jgi:4-hydroxybenzoate polyprenyltransferase
MNLRISDWWNSKVAMLVGWSYFFILLSDVGPKSYLVLFPLILIWLFSTAGFGYYINDCFDIEIDQKASKPNSVAQHSKFKRFFTPLFLATISIGSALFLFWDRPIFVPVVGFQLLLFILYSAPPFRWKEVPYLDIVTDSLYAQVIPVSVMALVIFANQTGPLEAFHIVIFCSVVC